MIEFEYDKLHIDDADILVEMVDEYKKLLSDEEEIKLSDEQYEDISVSNHWDACKNFYLSKRIFTREDLISLCERSVVSFERWNNRDSYVSQLNIQFIHRCLVCGLDYDITNQYERISIQFKDITEEQKEKYRTYYGELQIDSIDDYFEMFGRDSEMFESYNDDIDFSYVGGYIPTPERLERVGLEDWY